MGAIAGSGDRPGEHSAGGHAPHALPAPAAPGGLAAAATPSSAAFSRRVRSRGGDGDGAGAAGILELVFILSSAGELTLDLSSIVAKDYSGVDLTLIQSIHSLTVN